MRFFRAWLAMSRRFDAGLFHLWRGWRRRLVGLHRVRGRGHRHRGMRRVLAHFFRARLALGARFELMDAPLLLDDGRIDGRGLRVAPWLAAIALAPVAPVTAVAAAAVAASPAVLFTLAFGSLWARLLAVAGKRMELGRFA